MFNYFILGYCFCALTYIFFALCDFAMGFRMKYKLKNSNKDNDHD